MESKMHENAEDAGQGWQGWLDSARRTKENLKEKLSDKISSASDVLASSRAATYIISSLRSKTEDAEESYGAVLRESEALLALLQHGERKSGEASPAPARPAAAVAAATVTAAAAPSPSHTVSVAASTEVLSPAAMRLMAAHEDGPQKLRDELTLFVSNAQNPQGAALCEFVSEFRRLHAYPAAPAAAAGGAEASPASAPPPAAAPPAAAVAAATATAVAIRGVWANLGRPRSSSSASADESAAAVALAAAVSSVRSGLASLSAALEEQLPESLRADASAMSEAQLQLDAAAQRALFGSLSPLYLHAHAEEISNLAARCHELRAMLPCDMHQLPAELWLLPPSAMPHAAVSASSSAASSSAAAASSAAASSSASPSLAELRASGAADARLPYASAIQLLRTISFYRTPSDKAKVLLEACEEVVKCATRALRLRASALAPAARSLAAPSSLGADDLLPLVVYVVVRSGIYSLPAELAYVCDFLRAGLIHGQEGYALVSLQCACRVAGDLAWGVGLLHDAQRPADDPAPKHQPQDGEVVSVSLS